MEQQFLNNNERIEVTILRNLIFNEDFTRKTNPELWDKTQLEINRFRLDCAYKYSTLLKNDKLDKEIELYDTIRLR